MRRTRPWPPGTPCWLDLMTPDLEATQRFYGGLFGWQFRASGTEGYVTATLDAAAVGGLLLDTEHPPVWNVYLAVDDVDASNAAVLAAGGHLVRTSDVSNGRVSVCLEPTGAAFCLWQPGPNIGCEIVNEPGTFVWSELLTRDYDAAKQFHRAVFDVGLTEIGGDAFDFATIEVGGDTVAGIGRMSAAFPPEVPSHWRLYFASTDTDATVDRAAELGASVTVEAHDTPFGRWAGLADPLGARFCVITPPAG